MGEAYFNWIDTNGFEITIQNEGFSVVAVDKSCHQNFKSSYLTWLSWRVGRASTEKCVPHVQHDYFPAFIQSY